MTRIGLLSDTHGYLDPALLILLNECDEIWHAGDFGSLDVYDRLTNLEKPFRAVYGNIDHHELRKSIPEDLVWQVEHVKIFMVHIGGFPGKYPARIRSKLLEIKPDIFICGHSHILKVMYDKQLHLLHLNPGACGKEGFQVVRTALRFTIDGKQVKDMAVIELGNRSAI